MKKYSIVSIVVFFFSHSLSLVKRMPSAICRLVACACLFAGISFQPVYAASDAGFQAGQAQVLLGLRHGTAPDSGRTLNPHNSPNKARHG